MRAAGKGNLFLLLSAALTTILFISLWIPIHLPGKASDYPYDGTNVILRYEIFGCGSLVRTVEKGGEALYAKANLPAPPSGIYELSFTADSDEPEQHIESAEFYTGGLAEKYAYYLSVEIIGIGTGAPDCCEPKPAYNEIVPLVKIINWEPTTFTPQIFFTTRHYITILLLSPLVLLDILLLIGFLYRWARKNL